MATDDYTSNGGAFKASRTELALVLQYGSLHEYVIPRLNDGASVQETANHLGVSASWLYAWLNEQGYECVKTWRKGGDA